MPRTAIGGQRRHIILTKPQEDRLSKLARRTGMTPSEHIRRAIDSYFRLLDAAEARTKTA
jgi:predicted DNA-binding protein